MLHGINAVSPLSRFSGPAAILTPERQGRYWIDVASAYHQWGKPEPSYRALLAAEHAAPAEVRHRPPVHRIAEDLLRTDRRQSLPGLPAFARRIGAPAEILSRPVDEGVSVSTVDLIRGCPPI